MDYLKLINKFQNKWVALNKSRTKVLAADKDLKSLSEKVRDIKEEGVIFSFIQDENLRYTPCLR